MSDNSTIVDQWFASNSSVCPICGGDMKILRGGFWLDRCKDVSCDFTINKVTEISFWLDCVLINYRESDGELFLFYENSNGMREKLANEKVKYTKMEELIERCNSIMEVEAFL